MSLFERKPTSRERTQAERERARAERDARRAGREGREPAAESQAVATAPPERAAAAPEPVAAPAPAPEPPRAHESSADPEPVPAHEPAPEPELERGAANAPATEASPDPLPPAALVQPASIDAAAPADPAALDDPVAAADGHHDGAAAPDARRRGPRRWIPLALIVAVVLALAWFAISLFQPFHGAGEGSVSVRIPGGAGVSSVGQVLERRGVISSAFFFGLRVRLGGHSGDLHPGLYELRKNMSYGAAIDTLVKGPAAAKTVDVTIPEGRSIRQTSERLRAARIPLRGSYLAAARRSPVLDPVRYGAPRSTPNLEGFLFPDTYQVKVGAPASSLVTSQLQAFRKQFASVDLRAARRKNLSAYDVLIIASMIEREADLDRERPLIAQVIYNRLKQGIPLGIDATTRYELNNFTQPLSAADFARNSPYNTRLNKDLPPTPIGNPGIKSIQAAAHPTRGAYLYYVVKPGACGEHAFSTTYAQFLSDVQRYNSARAARGGNSPTTCR